MIIKQVYRDFKNFRNKRKFKGKNVLFHEFSKIDSNTVLEGYNAVGVKTVLNNTFVGIGSYVGRNNEFQSVKIGKFCSIGSYILNTMGRHPVSNFVSTHPAFFSKGKAAGFSFTKENRFKELHYTDKSENYFVEIGNDVWIGDRVTILDGVKIGDGAVIGSCALVTKDVEAYTINVGVPAKQIKHRFSEEQINFLKENNIWENEFDWIKSNSDNFSNIEILIKKMNNEK